MGVIKDLKLNKRQRVFLVECLNNRIDMERQLIHFHEFAMNKKNIEDKAFHRRRKKVAKKNKEKAEKLLYEIYTSYV